MTISNKVNDCVEALETQLIGKNIIPKDRPRRIGDSNLILFPFEIKRGGTSEILEELNPKLAKLCSHSMLNKGDRVTGKWLSGLSEDFFQKDQVVVGGAARTSNHPGQEIVLKDYCFTRVTANWQQNEAARALPTEEITRVLE